MPSQDYTTTLESVLARRRGRGSMHLPDLPPEEKSGEDLYAIGADSEAQVNEQASQPAPLFRGKRLALTLALGPATIPFLERRANELSRSRERIEARHESARQRIFLAQQRATAQQQKGQARIQEQMFEFGRDLYKKSGDPADLHPDDPIKQQMGLRGVVQRGKQAAPGLEPGRTWKSPTGETWYGGPTGKPVRSRVPRRETPSEFSVGEKIYHEQIRLSDITARIRQSEGQIPGEKEMAQYMEAMKDPKLDPQERMLYQYLLSTPDRVLRLKKKAQIVNDRIRELQQRVGQGGTGMPEYNEPDDEEEGGDQPGLEEGEEMAPPGGHGPKPTRGESAKNYWHRLVDMGFSERQADNYTADAIQMKLLPPDFEEP